MQHPISNGNAIWSRRRFLHRAGMGMGGMALGHMLSQEAFGSHAQATHFPGKAKHVIHVFLNGGMSQVDTFDPKPELDRWGGRKLPFENLQTERRTGVALPSPFSFARHGVSGIPVSDLFPHLSRCVDELAVIRSMYAELPSHELSLMLMNTGTQRLVWPSFGSWLTWGMGSENENLPGFVALCPGGMPVGGAGNWRSAFLPGVYQGTYVDTSKEDPRALIADVHNARMNRAQQSDHFRYLQALNRRHALLRPDESLIESRIQSFELAYRMQFEATDAFDVNQEPEHMLKLYGEGPQNRQLLIARRLVERGVRFVQTWHGNLQPWDSHSNIKDSHRKVANECDQGLAALIIDLKQRGLLDETLILCSGEFGRTPTAQVGTPETIGRDHHPDGFTMFMAGGGVKGGFRYGATDEFGYYAIEGRMTIHDLHATLLHVMGLDHEQLTYQYGGRNFRLTDVHGTVATDILV